MNKNNKYHCTYKYFIHRLFKVLQRKQKELCSLYCFYLYLVTRVSNKRHTVHKIPAINTCEINLNKTGVINDPLGQFTVPAGSDCRLILKFWDGRTLCENSDHYRPGPWSTSWIKTNLFRIEETWTLLLPQVHPGHWVEDDGKFFVDQMWPTDHGTGAHDITMNAKFWVIKNLRRKEEDWTMGSVVVQQFGDKLGIVRASCVVCKRKKVMEDVAHKIKQNHVNILTLPVGLWTCRVDH